MSIPITLVTGFLGSGKSSLINKVITSNPKLHFGLVINEFGDVKLESQIITEAKEEDAITELSNGCMCCVVRKDLIDTVGGLLKKAPQINHIILEASGLSDPVPIANTFLNDNLNEKIHFDTILSVIDVLNFPQTFKKYNVSEAQIQYADFILLTKIDLATPEQVAKVKKLILSVRPDARILEIGATFPLDLVFDTTNIDHSKIAELEIEEHHHDEHEEEHEHHEHDEDHDEHDDHHYHHVHEDIDTVFYKTEKPLNPERFNKFLKKMPQEVFRAKGFLQFDDPQVRDKKCIVQIVSDRPDVEMRDWEKGEVRQSAIVFIGRGINKEKLLADFKKCE